MAYAIGFLIGIYVDRTISTMIKAMRTTVYVQPDEEKGKMGF